MKPFTDKQKAVLRTIIYGFERDQMSPTIQEIARTLNCSMSSTYRAIEFLKGRGYLEHVEGTARGFKVVKNLEGKRVRLALVEVD